MYEWMKLLSVVKGKNSWIDSLYGIMNKTLKRVIGYYTQNKLFKDQNIKLM